MKQSILALAAMAITMTACTSNETDMYPQNPESSKDITFRIDGDFTLTTKALTRSLSADGKDMTDIWILDYQGATLKQQIHQTSDQDDFGTPTLALATGDHHIYFIASRGQNATLSTADHTLTFTKVLDTFYKDLAITVTASSSGSRNVTLDRCVTKLKVVFSDAIPATAATFNVTPASWYYALDYLTGEPAAATNSQAITINIPAASLSTTGESVNIYGFSPSSQWTTNIAVNCKASDESILGQTTITDAPFRPNRLTQYTGPLFSNTGATNLSLSTAWDDDYIGSW